MKKIIEKNKKHIIKNLIILAIYAITSSLVILILLLGNIKEQLNAISTFFIVNAPILGLFPFLLIVFYDIIQYLLYYFSKKPFLTLKEKEIELFLPIVGKVNILNNDIESVSFTDKGNYFSISIYTKKEISYEKNLFLLSLLTSLSDVICEEKRIAFSINSMDANFKEIVNTFINIDPMNELFQKIKNNYLKKYNKNNIKELVEDETIAIEFVKELFKECTQNRTKISVLTGVSYSKVCKYVKM